MALGEDAESGAGVSRSNMDLFEYVAGFCGAHHDILGHPAARARRFGAPGIRVFSPGLPHRHLANLILPVFSSWLQVWAWRACRQHLSARAVRPLPQLPLPPATQQQPRSPAGASGRPRQRTLSKAR